MNSVTPTAAGVGGDDQTTRCWGGRPPTQKLRHPKEAPLVLFPIPRDTLQEQGRKKFPHQAASQAFGSGPLGHAPCRL